MKTLIRMMLCLFFLASMQAAPVWAEESATNSFLSQKYGWTFGVKQESRLFGWSWNLVCPEGRAVLPESGKNVFWNWACRQEDRSYWTIVIWRLPSVSPAAIEKMIYKGMSDGLGYGKVECASQKTDAAGTYGGVIKDCAVPLQNGTFYASFYHFEAKVPAPYSINSNGGLKNSDRLAFTVIVQNAGISEPQVKEKLRELVSSMKFGDGK